MVFQKGHKPYINYYWKDKNISEETKKKISESRKGKKLSFVHRLAISKGLRKVGHYSEDNIKGRTRMSWRDWRKAVIERDRHICQLCLTDEGTLCAHHIKPFKTYISLRFDVSNGLILCRKCHADLHNFSLLTKKAVNSGKLKLLYDLLEALDNPEPSQSGNALEGATTNSRDVLYVSNADKSAVNHDIQCG